MFIPKRTWVIATILAFVAGPLAVYLDADMYLYKTWNIPMLEWLIPLLIIGGAFAGWNWGSKGILFAAGLAVVSLAAIFGGLILDPPPQGGLLWLGAIFGFGFGEIITIISSIAGAAIRRIIQTRVRRKEEANRRSCQRNPGLRRDHRKTPSANRL